MLDEADGQALVDDGISFLGQDRVHRLGRGVTGALSGGTVFLKGIRTHEPTSVLDVEKTSDSSRRASLKSSMTDGDQPAPWRSNVMSQEGTGADAGADDHQPPDLSAGGGYGG